VRFSEVGETNSYSCARACRDVQDCLPLPSREIVLIGVDPTLSDGMCPKLIRLPRVEIV
jgi:hypothetical protein